MHAALLLAGGGFHCTGQSLLEHQTGPLRFLPPGVCGFDRVLVPPLAVPEHLGHVPLQDDKVVDRNGLRRPPPLCAPLPPRAREGAEGEAPGGSHADDRGPAPPQHVLVWIDVVVHGRLPIRVQVEQAAVIPGPQPSLQLVPCGADQRGERPSGHCPSRRSQGRPRPDLPPMRSASAPERSVPLRSSGRRRLGSSPVPPGQEPTGLGRRREPRAVCGRADNWH